MSNHAKSIIIALGTTSSIFFSILNLCRVDPSFISVNKLIVLLPTIILLFVISYVIASNFFRISEAGETAITKKDERKKKLTKIINYLFISISVSIALLLVVVILAIVKSAGPDRAHTPAIIREFVSSLPDKPTNNDFMAAAQENIWSVYADSNLSKDELLKYISRGPNGPGIAYAALALMPFHDPYTVETVLNRASANNTSNDVKLYLLNTAPYILSIGDVWYNGDVEVGEKTEKYSNQLISFALEAKKNGSGNTHAKRLVDLYKKPYDDTYSSDIDLVRWHKSAYLIGTLDLKDYELLEIVLDPAKGLVFNNIIYALSFATNKEFFAQLKWIKRSEVTKEQMSLVAKQAKSWWKKYLEEHPDGDWLPAIISGFNCKSQEPPGQVFLSD